MDVRAGDLRAAYDLVGELAAAPDEDVFWQVALTRLLELIPATRASWNVWDYRRRTLVEWVGLAPDPHDVTPLTALWHQLPWLRESPPEPVRSMSLPSTYFLPHRELVRLEVFDAYYKQRDAEYGLGIAGGSSAQQMRGVLFERADRDFSAYEIALAALLSPHLTALHRSLRTRARLAKRLRELEAAARERPVPAAAAVAELTPREAQVLALVADGLTNPQIAARLYTSPRTVQKHLQHAFEKLGVRTRAAATARYLTLVREPAA